MTASLRHRTVLVSLIPCLWLQLQLLFIFHQSHQLKTCVDGCNVIIIIISLSYLHTSISLKSPDTSFTQYPCSCLLSC